MGRKADLQAKLDRLGVTYRQKDTIAVLEGLFPGPAPSAPEPAETPEEQVAAREERRSARRAETAVAGENRGADQHAAALQVRTAAQQAMDRSEA